jgi:hypothetical protein
MEGWRKEGRIHGGKDEGKDGRGREGNMNGVKEGMMHGETDAGKDGGKEG